MRQLFDPLYAKRLYVTDLAVRLEAMETIKSTGARINATAYRLFARRLHKALAGYPEAVLAREVGGGHSSVREALAMRRFDVHGCFDGPAATAAQSVCDALLWRLTQPVR
ncbi:MAG: hypothetical protein LH480_10075 [Rubrivivax sp.]|nr:hypothetical protein [Rubrivivax sp.]